IPDGPAQRPAFAQLCPQGSAGRILPAVQIVVVVVVIYALGRDRQPRRLGSQAEFSAQLGARSQSDVAQAGIAEKGVRVSQKVQADCRAGTELLIPAASDIDDCRS